MVDKPSRPQALALGLLVLAVPLAGCAQNQASAETRPCAPNDEPIPLPYASFEEAMDAPGTEFEANNTDSSIKLKLLTPENPEDIDEGSLAVVVLLYDSETGEPVTDASFEVNAQMPAMGHGTSPEAHPTHEKDGMYIGCTTISMPGDWLINLDPQLADGTVLEYDVEAQAGDGGMGDMQHDNSSSNES
jgi:hypothetical protein